MSSSINSVLNTTTNSSDSVTNPNQTLTEQDFLKLLVTQMSSQDPLNPVSDTDFAAQLAQFSSLQQSTNMAGYMQEMQANTLIGSTVTVASTTNTADTTTGQITGVDLSSGTPQIVVNGTDYALSQIQSITPTSTPTQTSTTGATSTAQ